MAKEQRFGSEESRDGCFTGDELLVGAVGATQAREGRGLGYRIEISEIHGRIAVGS